MTSRIRPDAPEQITGLGPKSRDMLHAAGISSISQLRGIGAVAAYVMVKRVGCNPNLNFLWGLESAISGEHWRDVAKKHRASLLLALDEQEKID
jgi:DNA transformation protein